MSVDAAEVQRRWKSVARHFPLWRFLFDLVFDPQSWRMIGADITSLVVESKNVRRATRAMDGASAETLGAMAAMARVNELRANDIFRAVFLGYVSVPLGLAAMLSDEAPEALNIAISEFAPSAIIILIGALVFPIVYFCGAWRAKQIAWVIELYRAGAIAPLPEKPHGKQDQSRRQAGEV